MFRQPVLAKGSTCLVIDKKRPQSSTPVVQISFLATKGNVY